jgi:hypothetical protein
METRETAKKGLYVGVGAGLILFVLVGLLSGSLVGGLIGLKIAGGIFGIPLEAAILPRLIVALSMVAGIMISATVFIVGSAIAGWLAGYVVDTVRDARRVTEVQKAAVSR